MKTVPLILAALVSAVTITACTSPLPSPGAAKTTSLEAAVQCTSEQEVGLRAIEDADKIQEAYCREGYAFVRFAGAGVGVHGTQDAFFAWQDVRWTAVAWGETSHGAFNYETLAYERADARRLATLFPEAGMTVPPPEPGFSVIIRADGIGRIILGMTEEEARAASPFPLDNQAEQFGSCSTLVIAANGANALTVLLDHQGKVFAVSVAGGAQTAEGIHTSSTRNDLVAGYGARLRAPDTERPYVEQGNLRIVFHLMNQIVARIDAGRFASDTAAGACVGD